MYNKLSTIAATHRFNSADFIQFAHTVSPHKRNIVPPETMEFALGDYEISNWFVDDLIKAYKAKVARETEERHAAEQAAITFSL